MRLVRLWWKAGFPGNGELIKFIAIKINMIFIYVPIFTLYDVKISDYKLFR